MKLFRPFRPSLLRSILLVLLGQIFITVRADEVGGVSLETLRAAVTRALPLIERSSAFALQERACFTCHHGAHPSLVIHDAWARGFPVNTGNLEDQFTRAYLSLLEDAPRFKDGWAIAGTADGPGNALWILDTAGWPPDPITTAATDYFLRDSKNLDHWAPPMRRPPTVGSHFTTTYLVLRALRQHRKPELALRIHSRTDAAEQWLLNTPAANTEDSVYRLRALRLLEASPTAFQSQTRQLLAAQQADGGWPQTPDTASDAYATGTVLAALHDATAVPVTAPAFQRGLRYLLAAQAVDGSWHVRKRTHDVQPFFDSAFPHGQDQFISISATSWAAYALLRAIPPTRQQPYFARNPLATTRLVSAARPDSRPFTAEQIDFFRQKIEPVLAAQCYSCHSAQAKNLKAGLYLDTRGGILTGGESGPALRPHDPGRSLIIRSIIHDRLDLMPPKKQLPAAIIADFRRWIEMGAPDPRTEPVPKRSTYP